MKVLLTGGTGFLGKNVARGLAARGHALRVLARSGSDLAGLPEGFEVGIPVGRSFDLLHETVKLGNDLPDTAKITDTWTANVFIPKVSATAKVKYRIRGRPKPSTTGR